jgi:cell division protein ZapE
MQSAEQMQPADVARDEEIDAGDFSGPLEWYWHFSQRHDYQVDSEQLRVLEQLERLFNELEDYRQYRAGKLNRLVTNLGAGRKPPRGIYIWGGVGRGKSLMMDAFFKVSRHRRKRRVHFHEFMREIHARMRALSGTEDPLEAIATEIARDLRLLAFDEFHVSDIADAMILARLLELLIDKGVVLVLTSNYKPDDLYPNGLQRSRFLPAIEVLKRDLDVVELSGATDHRRRLLDALSVYYTPIDAHADENLAKFFEAMTKATYSENGTIDVGGRPIAFRRRAKGVIWFDFHELFEKPRSQVDYLEIASAYHTVLISGVRRMLPSQIDVVRRLTWLVDVFYDQRVKLALSAEVPAEELVAPAPDAKGPEVMVHKEFGRTASRLREMQSRDYFGRKHASAANPSVMAK